MTNGRLPTTAQLMAFSSSSATPLRRIARLIVTSGRSIPWILQHGWARYSADQPRGAPAPQAARRALLELCSAEPLAAQDEAVEGDRGRDAVPPPDRIGRRFVARLIDHLAPAAGDADGGPRQHRFGEHQLREQQHK